MEEKKKSVKDFIKNINTKVAIKIFAIAFGFILVIITAIVDVGLDPSKIDKYKWLTNALITTGIMVYGLIMGESVGKDNSQRSMNGLYQKNLKEYNDLNKELEPIIIYFSQFYYGFTRKELRKKKIDYLKRHDVDYEWCELILDYITPKNVNLLLNEEGIKIVDKDGKEHIIPQQTENQLEAIKSVLNGEVKIDEPSPNYFLNAFETTKVRSELEEPKHIDTEIQVNTHGNRALKIATSLVISVLWAMLTVNEFMGGDSPNAKTQAWMNLVSRITALITSLVSGWSSAIIDTKLRARKIKGKYNMLVKFKSAYNQKEFIPVSKRKEAQETYDRVMKEREEARKNVITPEVVETNDPAQIEDKTIYIEPLKEK